MSPRAGHPLRNALLVLALALAGVTAMALWWWRDDILRTALDPKQPYQTYRPPPAPAYAERRAWALLPADPARPAPAPAADVFFVHATTYDGGREWNAPIDEARSQEVLQRTTLPNTASPFARAGRLFAPKYRQASLYAELTLREDARDARRFAYGDVRRAFDLYLARWNAGRPLILVGVEQGGMLAARLAAEVAGDPALRTRLVVVYLIQAAVPAADYAPGEALPACAAPAQTGCVVSFAAAGEHEVDAKERYLDRAAVWTPRGQLEGLDGRAPLCVNPLTGAVGATAAGERANRGAVNATGLEWGVRPALMPQQVGARCDADGLLRVSDPRSPSLRRTGGWTERQRVPAFNLFYADEEADAMRRLAAFQSAAGVAPPMRERVGLGG